ncbi:hypothetical protein [[Clostridium] symbiosum]|jgi:uncharacterized phage protein (TIGR02220 family)
MAYMNYISAINSFWDTAALNPLSTGQVSLYFALLHVNNRSNWTEWFTVPNQVLSVLTGLSRSGILKARNELRQRGLIEFRERGTKATQYKMLTMSDSTQDSTRDSTQKGVQNSMQDGVQNSSTLKDININENRKSISNDIPEKMDFSEQYTTIQDLYNSVCGSYPRLVKLSEARKKAIRARLNTGYTVDDFRRLFKTAEQSDFLKGKNNRNWRATFDWLISDANMAKVLDGNYENRKKEAEPDATEGRSATDYYRQYMHHSDGETGGDVPD